MSVASTSFGKKAVELVREIADSEPGALPPFNQDLIRTVSEQCKEHLEAMGTLASRVTDETCSEEDRNAADVGLRIHHQVRYATRARD